MDNSYVVGADLYDFVVDYRYRPDVSFFVDLARASGGNILELGCGTGRVLIPTARAGFEITGVDLSSQMLTVCEQKLQQEHVQVRSRVRLVHADMREFQLSQEFALVTIPFRPFQHLIEVADQLSCLECIHRHLNDSGKLVLDVFNPSLAALTCNNLGIEELAGPDFTLPDGRRVAHKARIVTRDLFKQILSIELIYDVTHLDGHVERLVHAFSMRYFFRYELEHLLARAGFAVDAIYGDYVSNPFGDTAQKELIVVARKSR